MAEVITKITDITEKIKNLLSNFKKHGTHLKVTVYVDRRIALLDSYYTEYKNLSYEKSDLIEAACKQLDKHYKEAYAFLDNYIPFDANISKTKSKSVEKLNSLTVPESLDVVNNKLFVAQNKLQ